MKTRVILCSVWGEKYDLLPHFIEHYRDLGIDEFKFIIQARKTNCPFIDEISQALQEYDLKPHIYIGPWNGMICTNLINQIKQTKNNEWFVVSDQDELQLYPKPLEQIIEECERDEILYVTGALLDRISKNGKLKIIESTPVLWDQFPNCGFISYPLARANPYKITLCKSSVQLAEGQHGVVARGRTYPIVGPVISQVHHFKWDASLIHRLQERLNKEKAGDWDNSCAGYRQEVYAILNYLEERQGSISLSDPLFLIETTKKRYEAYIHWSKVIAIMSSWSSLQKYLQLKER